MEMISASFIQQAIRGDAVGMDDRVGVASHFSACVGGVDARDADQRTKSFYRSSGNPWAMSLSAQ